MNNFIAGIALAFTLAFAFWVVAFDAIDRHMIEYQECGGVYCQPMDPPQ